MVELTPPPANLADPAAYDYLYQLQEYLSTVLDGGGGVSAAPAVTGSTGAAVSPALAQQYRTLKALIIKTADEVERHTRIDMSGLRQVVESLGTLLQGEGGIQATLLTIQNDYLARSAFGTYQEATAQRLVALDAGLEQQVRSVQQAEAAAAAVSADFTAYRVETEGYIRSGIVAEREDGTPVIGIAIGQDLTVMKNADGTDATRDVTLPDGRVITCKTVEEKGFRAIYAADELSFWQDGNKVAYLSNERLYITDVAALQSLTLGRWDIVDGAVGLVCKWTGGEA